MRRGRKKIHVKKQARKVETAVVISVGKTMSAGAPLSIEARIPITDVGNS